MIHKYINSCKFKKIDATLTIVLLMFTWGEFTWHHGIMKTAFSSMSLRSRSWWWTSVGESSRIKGTPVQDKQFQVPRCPHLRRPGIVSTHPGSD